MHSPENTHGHVLRGYKARFYDFGNTFFGVPLINIRHARLIRLAPGERLLDIGCGTGRVLAALHRRLGDRVTLYGIDPSPDMVRSARRRFGRCPAVWIAPGVGEKLDFPDDSLDWVVSCLTTHHLPRALKRAMVKECFRVLRPGGRLLLSDFGRPSGVVGGVFARIWKGHSYTAENLTGMLPRMVSRAGFTEASAHVQGGVILHLLAAKPVAAAAPELEKGVQAHA